jgi:hypothetical protein
VRRSWRRPLLSGNDDLGGKPHRNDDKRLAPVGLDNERIPAIEPWVEFAEAVSARFAFDGAIDA